MHRIGTVICGAGGSESGVDQKIDNICAEYYPDIYGLMALPHIAAFSGCRYIAMKPDASGKS